jgi:GntR family transcriptional regulator/MocR family aminotransferase
VNGPVLTLADGEGPLFARLAQSITTDILRGRLSPGAPLPGTRTLARELGVHRNTVLAAFSELGAEGWLVTRPGGGTFVSPRLPDRPPRRFARSAPVRGGMPKGLAFSLPPERTRERPDRFDRFASPWASAVPDARLAPVVALSRALRRALVRRKGLGYGDPRGLASARRAIAQYLSSQRGLAASAEDVLLVSGSQMGLDLSAQALVRPGDQVAVEALGYRPARDAFARAGATLVPIPVDGQGMQVERLAGLGVRAVVLTPHHHYPTTVTLSAERRLRLLELARAERFAIVEDDYDHEFHYDGRPVLPLASADVHGSVVYVGTLSKLLAPGLRLGFVVAPPPLLERMARVRALTDRQGVSLIEVAVAELIEDGELLRHARRARRHYQARRDALAEALTAKLGGVVRFTLPRGGMALWFEAPGVDVDRWAARATERGVGFPPGSVFTADGSSLAAGRLAFAACTEAELKRSVEQLAAACPRRADRSR